MKKIIPALGIMAIFGCKTKPIQYESFQDLKLIKLGYPVSTVGLNVVCYNPNKFGLKVTSFQSDVYANNEYLGKASLDSAIDVPRLDTFYLPVKMDVKMGNTVNGLLQMMSNGKDSINVLLKLEGNAKLRKGGLGINYPIKYEEQKTLKF